MSPKAETVHINSQEMYPLDEIARLGRITATQVCYWIATRKVEIVDGKIPGFWALIFGFLQEQRDLELSKPVNPRQKFQKYLRLACMLKQSQEGGHLYGDYRVNEFALDLVDLLNYFLASVSLSRMEHSTEEIYKQFSDKRRSMSAEECEKFDWDSLEGNIDNDEAVTFYRKLKRFRVFGQGRARYIENKMEWIKEMAAESFPGCIVKFEDTDYDSIFRMEIHGEGAYDLRRTLEDDGGFRMIAAPGKDCRDYYLIF